MTQRFNKRTLLKLLAPVGVMLCVDYASAQLEEVIVTATRREVSVQDVPMSISAIDGKKLENFAIANFYEMNVPAVFISQGGMNDNAFIRGIGQSGGNFGFENSAPFYIDGVYNGRARGTRLAWLDAERMEVIKGPVPTYLGKNASAGGISITSRRPTEELSGFLNVNNEFEADELSVTGAISGSITDGFRVRLAGKWREMDEGWMTNDFNGGDEPLQEDTLWRLSAEWDITDRLTAWGKVEGVDAQWNGINTQLTNCQPGVRIDPALDACQFDDRRASFFDPANHPTGLWDRDVPAGTSNINDFVYDGYAFSLTYEADSFEVTSLTAYYEYTNSFFRDADHSANDFAMANFEEEFDQFSQEIKIQSTGDTGIDWMAGVYYDDNNNVNFSNNSLPGAMGMIVQRDNDESADSWAVFGEVGIPLTDELKLTVGGRYTEYEKVNTHSQDVRVGAMAGQPWQDAMVAGMATFTILDNEQSAEEIQPSAHIEWRPDDETMYFASYKRGFKAGGLNHQPGRPDRDLQRILPETVDAVELGGRWELLDGRARLGATAFRAEYNDFQVSIYDPTELNFITKNAAEAITQGVEMDGQFAATDNLTFGFYLSLLDGTFSDYPNAPCWLTPAQTAEQGCVPILDGNGNPTNATGQDMSDAPLQFAPDYSGTFDVDYRLPLTGDLEMRSNLSVFFTDEYQISSDRDPDQRQDSFTTVDLRLAVGPSSRKWEVAFVGRNLTDEFIKEWNGNTPILGDSNFTLLRRTRQISLQAVYRLGD